MGSRVGHHVRITWPQYDRQAALVAQGWVDGLAEALCQPELHLGLL